MYSVKLNKEGYFTGTYCKAIADNINPIEDGIYVNTLPSDSFNYDCYKVAFDENNVCIWELDNEKVLTKRENQKNKEIRYKRSEVFLIIDFFQMVLVYNELSEDQKSDLSRLRLDWLDAPETKVIPETCEWMIEKYKSK